MCAAVQRGHPAQLERFQQAGCCMLVTIDEGRHHIRLGHQAGQAHPTIAPHCLRHMETLCVRQVQQGYAFHEVNPAAGGMPISMTRGADAPSLAQDVAFGGTGDYGLTRASLSFLSSHYDLPPRNAIAA